MDANDPKGLRGNQEVFLDCIAQSAEFNQIKERYLKNVFMGLYSLSKKVSSTDAEADKKLSDCADEISDTFKISKDNALKLLITPKKRVLRHLRYLPKVSRDGDEIVLRFGAKTSLDDVKAVWRAVKGLQKEIGKVGGKTSINPELAYCIHKQYQMNGRKMTEVFDDYLNRKLEGYNHLPTITDEHDFRKYYKEVVKGL